MQKKYLKTTEGSYNNRSANGNISFIDNPGGFSINSDGFISSNFGGYWRLTDEVVFYLNWGNDAVAKNYGASGGFSIRCVKN